MKKYGWENVRGGPWCIVNMKGPPTELKITDLSSCLIIDE